MVKVVLLVLAAAALLFVATAVLVRRRERVWRTFAVRHGLRFRKRRFFGRAIVAGTVEGRAVELATTESSSDTGPLDVQDMRLAVGLTGVPPGLEVTARVVAVELQDPELTTGDEAFDAALRVVAPDEAAARAWLEAPRRAALVRLVEQAPAHRAGIRHGQLYLRDRGTARTPETWTERLELLLRTARDLERPT